MQHQINTLKTQKKKKVNRPPNMPKPVSIFDTEFETEMVTLERIDNQKKQILKSYLPKGSKT